MTYVENALQLGREHDITLRLETGEHEITTARDSHLEFSGHECFLAIELDGA